MAEPGSAHSCRTLVGGLTFLAEQVPPVGQSPRVPVFMSESQIAEVLTQMADSQVSKSTLAKLQKQFEEMKAKRTQAKPEASTPAVMETPPTRPGFGTPLPQDPDSQPLLSADKMQGAQGNRVWTQAAVPPVSQKAALSHVKEQHPMGPPVTVKREPVEAPGSTLARPASSKSMPHLLRPRLDAGAPAVQVWCGACLLLLAVAFGNFVCLWCLSHAFAKLTLNVFKAASL